MTGVIYARYSSDNQREESIEGQIRENTEFARKNGIEIVETFIDRAYSAKTDNRPEFQRMIKDSFNHGFDVVIVWKLDRFARSRYDSAKYRAILRKNNVKVVSATEAISESSEGIILEGMLEAMAEYYSVDLAQKVKRGMTDNALKCRYNGGGAVPLGYVIDSDGHYQLDPANAAVAAELFERYAEGEPVTQITDDLNARGLRTSRGRLFNKSSIRNLLKNRNYIGEYHYMDVVVPGGVPAIVSEDLFERANARLEKNKRVSGASKGTEKYILTTKLFCGECGAMMVGESGQKKNTGIYRYYKCAGAKRHECVKRAVRKELIEDYVVKKAIETVSDPETVDRIVAQVLELQDRENATLISLEAQLKDVRTSIGNIVRAVENGLANRSIQSRLNELEGEEIRLQNDIEREKALHPKLTEDQIRFLLSKYASLSTSVASHREKLIDSLIGSIILYDDGRIIIAFNYRDKKTEANINDVVAACSSSGSDIAQDGSPTKETGARRRLFLLLRARARNRCGGKPQSGVAAWVRICERKPAGACSWPASEQKYSRAARNSRSRRRRNSRSRRRRNSRFRRSGKPGFTPSGRRP